MKKVILLRSNSVSPDPPVEKIANTLIENGYKVIIIGWERGKKFYSNESELLLRNGKVRIIRFGIPAQFGGGVKRSLIQFIQFQIRLGYWLFLNRNEYDIIHAFDFDTGFLASKCTKKFNKKLVYHVLDYYIDSHGLYTTKIGKLIKYEENKVINNADTTIICTEKRKEQIIGAVPKKLVVIHNTPDVKVIGEIKKKNTNNNCKIVYVGILDTGRFLKETIDFVLRNAEFELHIGGFGPYTEYISDIAKKSKKVFFYGKMPYEQTLLLESSCDVMIAIYDPSIPNHRYAAPNKFYEALMLGKPIIMSKNTGFDKIIKENNLGITIDYTKNGLSKGLKQMMKKKNLWDEMGRNAKNLYEKEYSWEIMEQRIKKLYNQL